MKPTPQIKPGSFLEGIPHAAMLLDKEYCILKINRLMEIICGYRTRQVQGIHGELIARTNTGNSSGKLFKKVFESGEQISVSGDILNCHRHKIPIQYTVSVVTDTENRRCGLLVIVEDISATIDCHKTGGLESAAFELIGYSPKMQKVFDLIPLLARTDASVIITGETGTGKDRIAEIIHKRSTRARFPFVKINCGALPAGLLESELFGHVKGAFTGATRNKQGMFELAHHGTLFLTEIGDMPLPLQVKLLSVLDDREFVPVGGEQKVKVDVRIIAATHRPLREQIQNNAFREDLFYRLHVLHLHLPPIRERDDDIRALLDHFLQRFAKALGKRLVGFTPEAMQVLMRYHYPGNIRELSNIVEYVVNLCKKKKIGKDMLPPYILETPPEKEAGGMSEEITEETSATALKGSGEKGCAFKSWNEIERQMIIDTLKKFHGNRTRSARELGWGRMKLYRKMKAYELM
ncbi:MAG: sigma-54-dependent Fis family transcriptional regulator [Desulfobacterales bacterium]|nr:MAG: sigma-54-dependent Fis family transcriptional regulator [Desulfobacterales bacterium]